MIEIHEVDNLEDLASHQLLWNSLLMKTAAASFFQSYGWFETYWRHYGNIQKMRVLVAAEDRRPFGILPLVVRSEQTRIGAVRILTYPLHDWGSFYSPLGANPDGTLMAGLRHIRRTRRDWDLLDLRWVHTAEQDRGRTAHAMAASGFPPRADVWDKTVQLDLTPGWQAYWASRSKKFRVNLGRFQRRLSELGEVQYLRYRPLGAAHDEGDPRWDLYDTCVELAQNSWQGSSTTGTTISHANVRDFLRHAHAAAAKAGAVDINLLYLSGRPAAFAYNYHYQGSVYGLRIGFDPRAARNGAGNLLFQRALEDSCLRGDHTYDLGPGYMSAKRNWLTRIVNIDRYTYFPPLSPRAQALRLKRWWTRQGIVASTSPPARVASFGRMASDP